MVSAATNTNGGSKKPPVQTHPKRTKTVLIIPAYHPDEELEAMTLHCIDSLDDCPDNVILQVDEYGDGYSKTVNIALKNAPGDVIIIGNNDLIFPDNWLDELLFPLQLGYDVATCWTSDQDYELEDKITSGDKFGSLFAMTRKVYETIGGFDEQFKGYFSDLDYRHRLLDAGFRIGMNRSLVVKHIAKATYKKTDPNDDEYQRAMRLYEIKYGEVE